MNLIEFSDGFEIGTSLQKVRCTLNPSSRTYQLTTYVWKLQNWERVFDSRHGLLSGSEFGLHPSAYRIINNSSERVTVLLTGTHPQLGYDWDVLIEVHSDLPWIRFRFNCHLATRLQIDSPEPSLLLYSDSTPDVVTLDQGPVSIYGGNTWGNSFPAAYLWANGHESILFFNPTSSRWMSAQNMCRFRDYRVATIIRDDVVRFGLHALSQSGNTIEAGHIVFEFYLLQREFAEKPSRIQALDRMIHACTALLPSRADMPENRVAPYELNWKTFAEGVIADLMREDISWAGIPSEWNDAPAFPEVSVKTFYLHSDYATNSSRTQHSRKTVYEVWDHACCNNFVAAWLIYNRLHKDESQYRMLTSKLENLPMFYDPQAALFRWGAWGVEQPPGLRSTMANGVEMSWENFMFNLETMKIHNAAAPHDFNPAILGKVLMACEGLVELAHNVNYVFPQWFDAYTKTPMMQLDITSLGKVREPFQVGSYAYLLLDAYAYTGDTQWLEEAKRSLTYVLTEMEYTEVNARYVITYTEAVDVPIAETFGNGYAVAAAQRLYNLTGDEKYLRYAADYLNILARMVFWYKDDANGIAQDLNNLGLFRAHGGHFGTCPWENIEAFLPLTVYLKYNTSHDELLLKLFNLQRINSYYYYPPVWTDRVAEPNPELVHHICRYLPIENFYTLEFGGTHGSMGRCIYMCSQAIWNYLLYEAFASSNDPEIMVLNLDLLDSSEAAVEAIDRRFIVYNPSDQRRDFKLRMSFLQGSDYQLSIDSGLDFERQLSRNELMEGVSISLNPHEYVRLHLMSSDSVSNVIADMRHAQGMIAQIYVAFQKVATVTGTHEILTEAKDLYSKALASYADSDYAACIETCKKTNNQIGAILRTV